jgi:glycosyltransferase involved in cell wall biosynthesis
MRIAVVETSSWGGLLHYAAQLADGLAGRGHEVDLLVPHHNELHAHGGPARMRAVLPRPVPQTPPPSGAVRYFARRAGIAARLSAAWLRVLAEVWRGHYDAVLVGSDIAQPPATCGLLALAAMPLRPPRPLLVNVCHNARPYNRWDGDNLFLSRELRLLRRAYASFDLVLAHGEATVEEFRRTWSSPAPVVVVPHGDERIFADEPPPPAAEERILFFGDWRKVKGIPVLMEAFDLLATRRPGARLTIAGTPSPRDLDPGTVRAWASRHGDRVTLVDRYVAMEDVPAVFGTARVLAAPYLVAFQSGVVHLAMTMGRAVVASRVGDLPASVVHEETGLLVPPEDPEALAAALERVLADPGLAVRLGAEGRRRVLSANAWEAVAETVESALLAAGAPGALEVPGASGVPSGSGGADGRSALELPAKSGAPESPVLTLPSRSGRSPDVPDGRTVR